MECVRGGTMEDLDKIWEQARSLPDGPRGRYIGAKHTEYNTYFFYEDGEEYFYETDYDRRRRKELKNARSRSLH